MIIKNFKGNIKNCIRKYLESNEKNEHKLTVNKPGRKDMELLKEIKSLDPWFYPVKIKNVQIAPGIKSDQPSQRLNDRTLFREHLIIDEVLKKYDLKNKSILELACNIGYWSSRFVQHGANFVVGVEGRDLFLKQAELFWSNAQLLPKDKYNFIKGDVLDKKVWKRIKEFGNFDVSLCMGILYHIKNYTNFLKWISEVTNDLIIIDTRVSKKPERLIQEPGDLYFNSIKQKEKKIIPNLEKLTNYLISLGFEPKIVEPRYLIPNTIPDCDNYNKRKRVTILARKLQ